MVKRMGASNEAQWLTEMVHAGRMTADQAREAIAVPDGVRSVWGEASDSDSELAIMLSQAATFRQSVAEKFEKLLAAPAKNVRQAKCAQRSVRHGARLPVMTVPISLATETGQGAAI
jgi:hypothetical protein